MTAEPADNPTFNLQLPAELEYLPTFLDHVRQAIEVAGLADAHGTRLELAVEEALVNVFNYAYAGQNHPGAVTCQAIVAEGDLTVEIIDEGPPFDPLARPDPDTTLELDQRQPGGLGIFMIQKLADEVGYRREDSRNVLLIRMRKAR
ncbi:MAG: serine/threonine-protein kinase RsbW [Pseudomonadota bacterium]|nr:serine/threonine-protein kinase RsbW [Pseudomonadota bacterium]